MGVGWSPASMSSTLATLSRRNQVEVPAGASLVRAWRLNQAIALVSGTLISDGDIPRLMLSV